MRALYINCGIKWLFFPLARAFQTAQFTLEHAADDKTISQFYIQTEVTRNQILFSQSEL